MDSSEDYVPDSSEHIRQPNSDRWEAIAESFIRDARRSTVGVSTIRTWAESVVSDRTGRAVLDLGCGPGTPRSEVLFDAGLHVFAIDASPTLAAAYRQHFPGAWVACESVDESHFFDRTFDAVLCWGLVFLLPVEEQRSLIHRVSRALKPGGRFLFTAPAAKCTWADISTGQPSQSLGTEEYRKALEGAGLRLLAEYDDEGENHYYDSVSSKR